MGKGARGMPESDYPVDVGLRGTNFTKLRPRRSTAHARVCAEIPRAEFVESTGSSIDRNTIDIAGQIGRAHV